MLCGPLISMNSVVSDQAGCCVSMTRAGCCRRESCWDGEVLSTRKARAVFGLLARNPTGVSRVLLSQQSLVGMYLSGEISLNPQGSCYFSR